MARWAGGAVSRSPRALFVGIYADRGKITLGVALILLTLVVLSGLLSRGIARPIEALGRATRAVADGRGAVPPPPQTAAVEVQSLYADFAAMAEAIDRRSRYLRDFAHAVSHEFKTPLAGIAGAVELLQDHTDMAPADRERFLANMAADAARLSNLTSRLLELAHADMAGGGGAAADVALGMRRLADAEQADGFAVMVEAPMHVSVAMPQEALETILSTLVENSRQVGASSVRLSAEARGADAVVTVRDDGPGIAPGDRARIFEPFFTTRRTTGRTGLGLAIARSLLQAHRGSITLADHGSGGATFVIVLPRAPAAD